MVLGIVRTLIPKVNILNYVLLMTFYEFKTALPYSQFVKL